MPSWFNGINAVLATAATAVAVVSGAVGILIAVGAIGGGGAELPPSLFVQRLWVEPQQVGEGEPATIYAEVTNPGETSAEINLSLEIDGQVFETRSPIVTPRNRSTESFKAPPLPEGLHVVSVNDSEARYFVGNSRDCSLRTGIEVRLQNITGTIKQGQDGHVELSFRNPAVNECNVDADLLITFPSRGVVVYGKEGVASGGAGTVSAVVDGVPPGGERISSVDLKCQDIGEYPIVFRGTYWPAGNKDLFQPVTLWQQLKCEGPSDNLPPTPILIPGSASTPSPEPTATFSTTATPTLTPAITATTAATATLTPTPVITATSSATPSHQITVLQWKVIGDRTVIDPGGKYWEKYEASTNMPGLYLRMDSPMSVGDFTELKADGTFDQRVDREHLVGTWEVQGSTVILTIEGMR